MLRRRDCAATIRRRTSSRLLLAVKLLHRVRRADRPTVLAGERPSAPGKDGDGPPVAPHPWISVPGNAPISRSRKRLAPPQGGFHRRFPLPRRLQILLHVPGAHAPAAKLTGIVRVSHDVDISNVHRLAHFALLPVVAIRPQILGIDALPSLMGNAGFAPLTPLPRDGLTFVDFAHGHANYLRAFMWGSHPGLPSPVLLLSSPRLRCHRRTR